MNIKEIYDISKKPELRDIFDSKEFESKYCSDLELGAIYLKDKTIFRLWSPVASKVTLQLFCKAENKNEFNNIKSIEMHEEENVWRVEVNEDLNKVYYRYEIKIGNNVNVVTDPYSKAVAANGQYSMVLDLEETNPEGWDIDKKPALKAPTDSIIYEMHIRDFSIDENSGSNFKGKYKGVWEANTKTKNGVSTGIDHLKELGITHVHLLPTFDYKSIDETRLNEPQYNWGYDPEHYNSPEGSYSTNPFDGDVRVKEFKEMVLNLHKQGIRVVMDVVYNHTYATNDSLFNKVVPYYYYREDINGNFSNGSACGNETASDRKMFRKFMIDSIIYWAKEYHIDGFRFDLMGLHDIETMKLIREEVNKIDDSIIIYGEGWTGGDTPLPENDRALKKNTVQYDKLQIAAFSDDMRDGVKGDVFVSEKPGFANNGYGFEETIKSGIVASINHDQIDYSKVIYSDKFWANEPYQTITYASAHDNYTLWDKLCITSKWESEEERIKMNKLISAIILTSQGISFIHAGEEFLRTKKDENGNLIENSYNSSDLVNRLEWERKEKYSDVFKYYKSLINLRKSHKAFRMDKANDIRENLRFLDAKENNVVLYTIDCKSLDDTFKKIVVIFNANKDKLNINLPDGTWKLIVNGNEINENGIIENVTNNILVDGRSANILVIE